MRKLLLILLFSQWVFSQSLASDLEQKIYAAVDALVANPSEQALAKLELQERNFNARSKSELIALVILDCNKAYYLNQFGQTQKAIKSYEKAWRLFDENKLSNYDIIESCLQPLGNLYTIIGDYENAENTIKQYFLTAVSNKNSDQIFAATLNLSNVYHNTGRSYESVELITKIMKLERFSKTQRGILYNNLGNNLVSETTVKVAQHSFQKSIDLLSSDPTQLENLSNAYRNLAKNFGAQKDFASANLNMQKAEALFYKVPKNTPREKAQFYFDKASLFFMQNDFGKAQENVNQIFSLLIPGYRKARLPNKNSVYAETALLDAFDLQASIFLVQNQPKKALESYALAFHIEELFQLVLVYENSKIISQIRNRNRTEKCIEINNSLFKKEKKISYIEAAFLLSEQTKSAVLKQSLKDSKTNSRTEKLILEQLQNWNTVIVKEQQKQDNADISKINTAIKKQNELMLLLKSERSKTSKTVASKLKMEDLYTKLDTDKAVLTAYFMGEKQIYIFTVSSKKIKLELTSTQDNTKILSQFMDLFQDSQTISNNLFTFNQISNAAYNILRLPKKSSYKNLIIIPDGILNFLPFETLITQQSPTANFAKMSYLMKDFKIVYNNSADFYMNARAFQHQKATILGVFPLFEGTDLELVFSKKELENLQKNFKGKYLDRQKATFENFKSEAANYSILHLSTHAASGDISAPATIRFYEEEVLYSEFYNLNLNPDLVVLSACETGIGRIYKAEGPMSVARGFQFAGAQNLLFSLWKVNDFTTTVFMEKFYAHLKNGESYFDANHQAKLDFLADESIPNAKKSPYYWSAFVYYGSLEKPSESNYFWWMGLLGGLIALLLLWKLFFRKK